MDLNKFCQSKLLQGAIGGLAVFIILLLIFKTGVFVGQRKADFSHRFSDSYHRNFAGPKGGFLKNFGDRDFMEASGIFGQIIKIDGQTLVVKGGWDAEKIILIKDGTIIKKFQETIESANLKIDDYIVTIGEPNDKGQIEAKLIRVMPLPPPPEAPGRPLPLPQF